MWGMPLPSLTSMWNKYPTGSAAAVKSKIGGNINMGWVTNTCVVRVSYCFNYCGEPIPARFAGMLTARGGDGKRYALRVSEFKPFLEKRYKAADINGASASDFAGKTGIIMFNVSGWSDATGHFDLWNGSSCRHAEYFGKSSSVHLWTC